MACDELQLELEALAFTYPADELDVTTSAENSSTTISLKVLPRTGNDVHGRFAEAIITLIPGPDYPRAPPTITAQTKGLGEQRERALLALLRAEAVQQAGGMVLSHLCEMTADFISQNNCPEGDCAFCLTPLQLGMQGASQQLLKLPCYHVFHQQCYVEWWAWQQKSLADREREMVQHTGSTAAAALMDKMPVREETAPDRYAVCCPVCRMATPLADLQHIASDLQAATATTDNGRASTDMAAREMSALVSKAIRAQLAEVQQRYAAAFERQRAAGGIIEAPNYSIVGWIPNNGGGDRAEVAGHCIDQDSQTAESSQQVPKRDHEQGYIAVASRTLGIRREACHTTMSSANDMPSNSAVGLQQIGARNRGRKAKAHLAPRVNIKPHMQHLNEAE